MNILEIASRAPITDAMVREFIGLGDGEPTALHIDENRHTYFVAWSQLAFEWALTLKTCASALNGNVRKL